MKPYFFFICASIVLLASCAQKPVELLAPCTWEKRSQCGKIVPISHQEQL